MLHYIWWLLYNSHLQKTVTTATFIVVWLLL